MKWKLENGHFEKALLELPFSSSSPRLTFFGIWTTQNNDFVKYQIQVGTMVAEIRISFFPFIRRKFDARANFLMHNMVHRANEYGN